MKFSHKNLPAGFNKDCNNGNTCCAKQPLVGTCNEDECCLPGAICSAWSGTCPDGKYKKPGEHVCAGGNCNEAECCNDGAICSSWSGMCPDGKYKKPGEHVCAGGNCNEAECCLPGAICSSWSGTCPAGKRKRLHNDMHQCARNSNYQSKVIKVFQWRIQALKNTSAFGKDFSDILTTLGSGAALKLKIDDALKARGIAESISVSDPRISYQPAGKDYHQHYASHHSRDMISPDGRLHCKCDDWGRYSIIVTWDMGEHCT